MAGDPDVTTRAQPQQEDVLEEIDNPIERLKLLSGNDDEIAKLPRRDRGDEPARARDAARDLADASARAPGSLPAGAPEHGRGARVARPARIPRARSRGSSSGPLRAGRSAGACSSSRATSSSRTSGDVSTQLRNLYGLREIQAVPRQPRSAASCGARAWTPTGWSTRSRRGSSALPTFLIGGAALPVVASLGRATGAARARRSGRRVHRRRRACSIALAASWVILRGAALASRRIRLATRGATANALEHGRLVRQAAQGLGHARSCIVSVGLTLGCWIIVPILVGIGLAT